MVRAKITRQHVISLALALALHAGVFYGLWRYSRIPATPDSGQALLVNFIEPNPVPSAPEPSKPPQSASRQPQQQAAQQTATANEPAIPQPEPVPTGIEPSALPLPPGPVSLSGELAVSCSHHTAPAYPAVSQRLGETGQVLLRVELDESGRVSTARIEQSSNYTRLDEAALAAVKTWICAPPTRGGKPVGAVALQPFRFKLMEN